MTDRKYITLHAALLHIAFRGQPVPSNTDAFAALERAARELQTTLEDGRVVAIGLKNGRGPHQAIEDKFWVAAEFEAIADDEIDDAGNFQTYPDANAAWPKYTSANRTATYKDIRVDRYVLENLWASPRHPERAAAPAKPQRIALKTERDAQYVDRLQGFRQIEGRWPTFREDEEWQKGEGVTQDMVKRLSCSSTR